MSLIVEDGTGKPDADSYVNVEDCQAYATSHSLVFDGTPTEMEAALRNATIYLDTKYVFRGERVTDEQALEWPRTTANLPRQLVFACCELAVRARMAPLWRDVDPSAQVIEDTIGPLTTKFASPEPANTQIGYAAVTALLRRWLAGGGSTVKLVRA